jgi:hypothetical protein
VEKKRRMVNFLGLFLLFIRLVRLMYRATNYASISECIKTPYYLLTGIVANIII